MTDKQLVTWGAIAEKFFIPLALGAASLFIGYGANELSNIRKELQILQISVAKLEVEIKLYRGSK